MLEGDLSTGCMQVKVDEFSGVVSCSPWRVWLDSPSQPESQLRAQGNTYVAENACLQLFLGAFFVPSAGSRGILCTDVREGT